MNTWIAMADRLPPMKTPVLIHASNGSICVAILEEAEKDSVWWDAAGLGGYEWEWDWRIASDRWQGVTHWMPLPAAPQNT